MKIRGVAACLLLGPTAAHAQEVTGHMEGRVISSDGAAISGVEVSATSPLLLGTRTTISGEDGRYFLRAVPAGQYRIQLRRIGYRPAILDSVQVWLGTVTGLKTLTLQPQPAVELSPMIIAAENDQLDPTRTASSVILGRDRLSRLPLGRNFREIAMLLPEATPSFIGDGINVAGATGLENHYFVDGVDITTGVGDKSVDLPYNFIQQIQLHTGGASAEDAMTLGGTVNVVTPSGGNKFAGSTFGFFSNSALQSSGRLADGATQSGFTFYDAGATVSGPLARDRAWFFAAYNPRLIRKDFKFGFGSMSDKTVVHQFAGKLTALLGKNTTGTVTVLGDPRRSTRATLGLVPTSLPPLTRDVLLREDVSGGYVVSSRVQSQVGRSLLLESTLSHAAQRESGTPSNSAAVFVDYVDGALSGGHGFSYRGKTRRESASTDLSYQLRQHYLKVGARYEVLANRNSVWVDVVSRSGDESYSRLVTTADAPGNIENRNPSIFAQDVWQPTERLSVSAGVRGSRQDILNLSGTRGDFRVHDDLQPRAAIVYQLGRVGTQRIFASYARVVHQVTLSAVVGVQRGHTIFSTYQHDPRADSSGGVTLFELARDGNGAPVDDRVRATSSEQWSMGYARRTGDGRTLSIRAERRTLGDHVTVAGNDGNELWGNPGRGGLSAFPRPSRIYNALHLEFQQSHSDADWFHIVYTLSRTRGNFPGIYDSDLRFASPHYGPGFDRAASWENSTGLLPNDRTHVLKAFGSRNVGRALTVGASMIAASGTPLSEFSTDGAGIQFFVQPRGTAGRTPWIFDAGMRASWIVPVGSNKPHLVFDVEHLGNPGQAVDYDQLRYSCLAADATCENPGYGRVLQYQPPMTARLGLEMSFGPHRR